MAKVRKNKFGKRPYALLTDAHLQELMDGSGLAMETIRANALRSETNSQTIARILNWKNPNKSLMACLVFPYRDLNGNPTDFCRLKPTRPRDKNGKPVKYEQPIGQVNRAYFPVASLPAIKTPGELLIITEGEKKALAVSQTGHGCIGLGGVNSWQLKRPDGHGPRHLISDLAAINWKDREVLIMFDSDSATNPNVGAAQRNLAIALRRKGATVRIVVLPTGPNGEKLGADDFIVKFGIDAFKALVNEGRTAPAVGEIVTVRMDSIRPKRTEWLWKYRIPRGCLTLIDGDPGMGKSQLITSIAALVTRGDPMPLDRHRKTRPPANVLFCVAEDDISRTAGPRLLAVNADMKRVHFATDVKDANGQEKLLSLPEDIPALERLIRKLGIKLVVIDPIMAYIGGEIDTYTDHDVRRCLYPLNQMAERTGAAVVMLRHLNKKAGNSALYRGGGSIAFTATARANLIVGTDKEEPHIRVLAMVKTNLGPMPYSVRYKIEPVDNDVGGTSRVKWIGTTDQVAADILNNPGGNSSSKLQMCVELIKQTLAAGPVLSTKLEAAINHAGVKERTYKTARKTAGVLAGQSPKEFETPSRWYSKLKDQLFPWDKPPLGAKKT